MQQRGPLLTPTLLSQKFLVRPYKRDLFRLRALFIWLVQNIRPQYHQQRHDLILLQKQHQPLKSSNMRQRLSRISLADDTIEDIGIQKFDAMDLLQEESVLLSDTACLYESPEEVLERRLCQSSLGMAQLFTVMAEAAGFEEAKVIVGYLKGCYQVTSPSPLGDFTLELTHLHSST